MVSAMFLIRLVEIQHVYETRFTSVVIVFGCCFFCGDRKLVKILCIHVLTQWRCVVVIVVITVNVVIVVDRIVAHLLILIVVISLTTENVVKMMNDVSSNSLPPIIGF